MCTTWNHFLKVFFLAIVYPLAAQPTEEPFVESDLWVLRSGVQLNIGNKGTSNLRGFISIGSAVVPCACVAQEPGRKYKLDKKKFHLDSLKKRGPGLAAQPILDTTSYYSRFDTTKTYFRPQGTYYALKFHNNGLVQLFFGPDSSAVSFGSLKDADRYIVENDSLLTMELWRDRMAGMGFWKGKIYKDMIVFEEVNNVKQKKPVVYRRKR